MYRIRMLIFYAYATWFFVLYVFQSRAGTGKGTRVVWDAFYDLFTVHWIFVVSGNGNCRTLSGMGNKEDCFDGFFFSKVALMNLA